MIRADELQDIYPFVFKATCRWAQCGSDRREAVAGFEIVEITEEALKQVRAILRVLCFSDETERLLPLSDVAIAMTLRTTPTTPTPSSQAYEIAPMLVDSGTVIGN
jgi:hypothetical protein